MSISQRDIKLLWARAAGRCSFPDCRIKLTQDKKLASDSFPLGEQAHIVGENKSAPRGKSPLTKDERNSYFNLILLCPTHHTIVDNNPEGYPVEKLHLMKDQHELWVESTLSESKDKRKTAQDVIYADLIDATVEACQLDSWDKWASHTVSTYMVWDKDAPGRIFEFHNKILGAIWPNTLPELECSLKKLVYELHEAINTFCEHCEIDKGEAERLVEVKFYHIPEWNPKLYDELSAEYGKWHENCENHIREATKAANWFADVVRRDINPLFFATRGKFFIVEGPFAMLEFRSFFLEYTEEEKEKILRSCKEGFYGGRVAPKKPKGGKSKR